MNKIRKILGGLLVGAVFGIMGIVIGVQNYQLAGKTKPTPQAISAADLLKNGPGDNRNIQLTKFVPELQSIVVEGGDRKTYWDKAYIPLLPDDTDADPAAPQIILITTSIKNQAQLAGLPTSTTIQGIVGAWDTSLTQQSRDLLQQSYPKMDGSICQLINHDATPPSAAGSFAWIGGGIVVLIGTALFLLKAIRA